jgi:hypothetical protein
MIKLSVSWGNGDTVEFEIEHSLTCDEGDIEMLIEPIYEGLFPDPILNDDGEDDRPPTDEYELWLDSGKVSVSEVAYVARIDEHIYEDLVEHLSWDELVRVGQNGYTEYESGAAYAEQLADDLGYMDKVPDWLNGHIDWVSVWQCEFRHGTEYYEVGDNGRIIVGDF